MESYIRLSTLNDFIFCPKSIFYHNLYDQYNEELYQEESQKAGKLIHEAIDEKRYSTRKDILQGLDVYSEEYGICGKIDIFDKKTGELIERKSLIKRENDKEKIYLGYKLQLWGQMFCLEEMGYEVQSLWLYSIGDNRKYKVYKPSSLELLKFQELLEKYRKFNPNQKGWTQNTQKCIRCIYKELCDYYIGEVYPQLELFEETKEKL